MHLLNCAKLPQILAICGIINVGSTSKSKWFDFFIYWGVFYQQTLLNLYTYSKWSVVSPRQANLWRARIKWLAVVFSGTPPYGLH